MLVEILISDWRVEWKINELNNGYQFLYFTRLYDKPNMNPIIWSVVKRLSYNAYKGIMEDLVIFINRNRSS